MCNIPIKVSAHTSLNSSKGVIRSRDLEGVSEDEMLDNLSSQGVSAVKRIHIRRNNELVPTNTFILTFCKPDSIKAAISRSSQCSTTGVTKAVVCVILSVEWCI